MPPLLHILTSSGLPEHQAQIVHHNYDKVSVIRFTYQPSGLNGQFTGTYIGPCILITVPLWSSSSSAAVYTLGKTFESAPPPSPEHVQAHRNRYGIPCL